MLYYILKFISTSTKLFVLLVKMAGQKLPKKDRPLNELPKKNRPLNERSVCLHLAIDLLIIISLLCSYFLFTSFNDPSEITGDPFLFMLCLSLLIYFTFTKDPSKISGGSSLLLLQLFFLFLVLGYFFHMFPKYLGSDLSENDFEEKK